MPEIMSSASQTTCAAIAQILPVFLVALVAERVVRARRADDPVMQAQLAAAVAMRIIVDFALMIGIVVLMLQALIGIEQEGLEGGSAEFLWAGTGVLALLIAYRWLLFSTPLLDLMNKLAYLYATATARVLDKLFTALPRRLEWIGVAVARLLQLGGEAVFGVLTSGAAHGMEAIADWVSRFTTRRARRSEPTATVDDPVEPPESR